MKNIMIHIKNNQTLNDFISLLKMNFNKDIPYSKEVKYLIKEFLDNNWGVYLTTIENFKNGTWHNVYSVNKNKKFNMSINDVNEHINFMIIRNLGSVEGNFKAISEYLDFLIANYKGIALNNPIAMKKGMTKNYLTEIDADDLKKIGILTIPTKIYNKEISFNEIKNNYPSLKNYLIKPVTGELSNSLKCLKNIDESFLRHKESKVGGWVVQPIKNEIWNGEFQLIFIGNKLVHSQKKNYQKDNTSILPSQKTRIIDKYYPTENEISIMRNLIKYFKDLYNIKIDICRIDYMKNNEGQPILIEFEMVNPGFFIQYLKDEKTINDIIKSIREYCENK